MQRRIPASFTILASAGVTIFCERGCCHGCICLTWKTPPTHPPSHIDSRSASASLYLTRAQGAPCQVINDCCLGHKINMAIKITLAPFYLTKLDFKPNLWNLNEDHYEERKPNYDWQFDTAAETGSNRNKLDVADETKGVINQEMTLISQGCTRQFLFISMLGYCINF